MDRRKSLRKKSVFQPAYIEAVKSCHIVILRDLTESGAGFVGNVDLKPGERVRVRWGSFDPIVASVMWSRDGRFGLDANFGPHFATTPTAYRSVRIPMSLPAKIHINGQSHDGELLNLSQGGVAVKLLDEVTPGSLATIDCGEWSFEASTVKWSKDGLAGFRLGRMIPLPTLSAIVETAARHELQYA